MHAEEFNQIIENKIADIQNVLIKKAGEYAQDGDRLHTFKQAAHLQEVSMREALGGMMVKHTVSVYDMINTPEKDFPQELWEEKIGDHLNYLLLLLAVVWEEKNEQADLEASSDVSIGDGPEQTSPYGDFVESDSYVADFTSVLRSQDYDIPQGQPPIVAAWAREGVDVKYMEVQFLDGETTHIFKKDNK